MNDLRYRLRALLRRERMEAELDEELRFHMEREAEKYRKAVMSEEEARRSCRRKRVAYSSVSNVARAGRSDRRDTLHS